MPESALYSIGYGGRSIEEIIALLRRYEVEYLVDVRSQPYSRFSPEFSKSALDRALSNFSIRYVFIGDALGGRPADQSCYIDGKVDYTLLKEKPSFQEGLARVQTALSKGFALALLCSEAKPQECHRSKLIGEALLQMGINISHIDENGDLKSQEEVIHSLTHGQQTLFGPLAFTSRNKYTNTTE